MERPETALPTPNISTSASSISPVRVAEPSAAEHGRTGNLRKNVRDVSSASVDVLSRCLIW